MKRLMGEALLITGELRKVVFVGAVATYAYTRINRESSDIDFAVEGSIPEKTMEELGYHRSTHGKQPWFTPRGFKIDVYTDGLPGVRHTDLIRNTRIVPVGKKGAIRVASLEALIASKFRAGREQDIEDLTNIAQHRIRDVDWDGIRKITGDDFRARQIRTDMLALSKYERA